MASNKVYFVSGYSPRKGLFGVASFLHELEGQDVEFTRFYMTFSAQWANQEFQDDIVSVSYTKVGDEWAWWLLSKRGKVISSSPKGRSEEVIQGAGTGSGNFGYLSDLKLIDGVLYAAGLGRQVYARKQGQWLRADGGIRTDSSKVGFRAIDGIDHRNIYAVGYEGEIWRFDGDQRKQISSPTNKTLEAVTVLPDGTCYACGKSGVVLKGKDDSWEIIDSGVRDTFWGARYFKGKVYLSSTKGLYSVEDKQIVPLDLGRKVEGRRLYTNPDELWSMESHELWTFDGTSWQQVVCPDNL